METIKLIIFFIVLIIFPNQLFAQTPYFTFNGAADVSLSFPPRGSGGRAIVHYWNNALFLNYAGDFSGGTYLGPSFFITNDGSFEINGKLNLLSNGNLGLGISNPSDKLAVNGNIRAKEIKVETANWPDYVFDQDYKILGLNELEAYIKVNKHLPEMPSAAAMEKDGIALGEMNKLLLKKVEELTLHLIEKDKQVAVLEKKAANTEKVLFEINKVLDKGKNKNKPKK